MAQRVIYLNDDEKVWGDCLRTTSIGFRRRTASRLFERKVCELLRELWPELLEIRKYPEHHPLDGHLICPRHGLVYFEIKANFGPVADKNAFFLPKRTVQAVREVHERGIDVLLLAGWYDAMYYWHLPRPLPPPIESRRGSDVTYLIWPFRERKKGQPWYRGRLWARPVPPPLWEKYLAHWDWGGEKTKWLKSNLGGTFAHSMSLSQGVSV